MVKLVNLYTRSPITALSIPIRGDLSGVTLTVNEIFKCICQKAVVDEILSTGEVIRLDLSNYDTDHELERINETKKVEEEAKAAEAQKLEEAAKATQDQKDKEDAELKAQEAAKQEATRAAAAEFAKQEQANLNANKNQSNKQKQN